MKEIQKVFPLVLVITLSLITTKHVQAATARTVSSPYLYNFNSPGVLPEAGSSGDSWSPYWWVNSGGYLLLTDNHRGSTVEGSLPATDPWRLLYASSNAYDTDNGYHPQNIFRLVTRSTWGDARQEAYFDIKSDNLSASSNRNQSNGLLLFNRYQDAANLYYTGVRVDGSAIIKKKIAGTYYTMAEVKNTFPGTYDRTSSPDLLPKNKWIGLRSEVTNLPNGSVDIKLYMDLGWTGKWTLVASAVDDGKSYGGQAFTGKGYAGIRTDFMDVEFENFRLANI